MYFRRHYCLNKCHKQQHLGDTSVSVCEMTVCVCRVRLAHEFSLGFSDLLVDDVLLPDFVFLRIKWHLEHVSLVN